MNEKVDLETLEPGEIFEDNDGTINLKLYSSPLKNDVVYKNLKTGEIHTNKTYEHTKVIKIDGIKFIAPI